LPLNEAIILKTLLTLVAESSLLSKRAGFNEYHKIPFDGRSRREKRNTSSDKLIGTN
jgi:hypothetical protein